jgi:hypothetical protein
VVGCIQMGSVGASLLLWAFHFGLTLDKFQIYTDFKLQFQLYTRFFLKKSLYPNPSWRPAPQYRFPQRQGPISPWAIPGRYLFENRIEGLAARGVIFVWKQD